MASERAPVRLAEVIAALSLATDLAMGQPMAFVQGLLAHGQSTKQIAAALQISPKTADNHIQSIYSKIHVSTRAGATLVAIERGLLEDMQ